MASFRESPCWCAKVAFPTILCTVGIRCSVGAWSMFQPSDSAIVKSLLLNGSAMLAFAWYSFEYLGQLMSIVPRPV